MNGGVAVCMICEHQAARCLQALREQFLAADRFKVTSRCTLENCTAARIGDCVALTVGNITYIGELETLGRVFHSVDDNDYSDVACVHFWVPVHGAGSRYYKVMRVVQDPKFVALECVLSALTVARKPNGIVSCLIPASLRSLFS